MIWFSVWIQFYVNTKILPIANIGMNILSYGSPGPQWRHILHFLQHQAYCCNTLGTCKLCCWVPAYPNPCILKSIKKGKKHIQETLQVRCRLLPYRVLESCNHSGTAAFQPSRIYKSTIPAQIVLGALPLQLNQPCRKYISMMAFHCKHMRVCKHVPGGE